MTPQRIREAAQILGELGNGRMANELEALAAQIEKSQRLLKPPTANAGPCFCPPDKCQAPIIMGRQIPCRRETHAGRNAAAQTERGEVGDL